MSKGLAGVVEVIAHLLAIIYTRSLEEGVVLDDWMCANITPVFMKGSKSVVGNYRPVSLTCILCKVIESIVQDAIIEHLATNNLIHPSQHGFMKSKSCLTNLLEYLEVLTKLVNEGHAVNVMYLDFAKAFDKVPHRRLLLKMKAHGIEGKVLEWVEAWLNDRKQWVVLNGKKSSWEKVESRVQGSVMGPTCFIIFIKNIDTMVDTITGIISKFADTNVGRVVENDSDRERMQKDLDRLLKWSEEWQTLF
jgi:hypothetical protein